MIIDLKHFIEREDVYWKELEKMLARLSIGGKVKLTLKELQRFNYLYQRCSSDLAQLNTFAVEPELRQYLENLVGRAYCLMNSQRQSRSRFRPLQWIIYTLPNTFRRRWKAFALSTIITLAGALFGALALTIDKRASEVIFPAKMEYLHNPDERVKKEETEAYYKSAYVAGSAWYFQHNARAAIMTMGAGVSFGIGTIAMLFLNGAMVGAVFLKHIMTGHGIFVFAWLLPHGVIEIPAILIGGQCGLMIASAMIGWRQRLTMRQRLTKIAPDLVTLIGAAAFMMLWAGIIESNFSQTHEPVLPYSFKISVGVFQFILLVWYFLRCGRKKRGGDYAAT